MHVLLCSLRLMVPPFLALRMVQEMPNCHDTLRLDMKYDMS
jgi:hypothetical protein